MIKSLMKSFLIGCQPQSDCSNIRYRSPYTLTLYSMLFKLRKPIRPDQIRLHARAQRTRTLARVSCIITVAEVIY